MEVSIGISLVVAYWYLSRTTGFFLYAFIQRKRYIGSEYLSKYLDDPPRWAWWIPVIGEMLAFLMICIYLYEYAPSPLIEERAIQLRLTLTRTKVGDSPEAGSLSLTEE